MSKPQAAPPRSNFLQLLLIGAMVFLGVQMFTAPQRASQSEETAAQLFTKLQEMNALLQDESAVRAFPMYERKVREEGKTAKRAQEEIDADVLKGAMLVVDTKLKSGDYRHQLYLQDRVAQDLGYKKMFRGYDFYKPRFERLSKTELWQNTRVEVTPTQNFPATEISPGQLYSDLVATIQPLAKEQKVWGVIPGFKLIDSLVALTGRQPWISYTAAAFILALLVRLIIWPLTARQLVWGRQMQSLAPLVKEIQAKYKDKKTGQVKDPQKLQMETMSLYREYGINPVAGCLPLLVQMPFFFAIYGCMLTYRFEFTKGYFLWVHPGATEFLGIPLAVNLGERDYILVALYMLSMIASTLMTPVSDPSQVKQQRLMGIGLAVFASIFMFFYSLPSAFIVYWISTNLLQMLQTYIGYRRPLPPLQKVATPTGGFFPFGTPESAPNGQPDTPFFGKTGTPRTTKATKRSKKK